MDSPIEDVAWLQPQSQSPLLTLPRELRDQIYESAFGHDYRMLKLGDLPTLATDSFPIGTPPLIHGLPSWLLGCKRILSEALWVFRKTRRVSAIRPAASFFKGEYEIPPGVSWNPLVFNQDVALNVVVSKEDHSTITGREVDQQFLLALKRLNARNMCLETVWNMDVFPEGYSSNANSHSRFWTTDWNGRFQRANITIVVYDEPPTEKLKQVEEKAEACARRLVGRCKASSWGSWEQDIGGPYNDTVWKKTVTV